jgi:hypothetical protein
MDIDSLIAQTEALSWDDPSSQIESLTSGNIPDECLPLVGHVISQKTHNNQSVFAALSKAWEFAVPFSFTVLGPNKFLFKLSKQEHLLRIQKQATWNVNGSVIILKLWNPLATLGELTLNKASFWIQVHGLPLINMTTKLAISIGKGLGDLIQVENPSGANTTFKSYLRILVEIDVIKPLKPGFSFKRDNGETLWIFLKYERLDTYCSTCGRLDHKSIYCMAAPEEKNPARYAVSLKLNIFSNLKPSSPSPNPHQPSNIHQSQPSNPHNSAKKFNQSITSSLPPNLSANYLLNTNQPASSSKQQDISPPDLHSTDGTSPPFAAALNTNITTFSTASVKDNPATNLTKPHIQHISPLPNQTSPQPPVLLDPNLVITGPSLTINLPFSPTNPSASPATSENLFTSSVITNFQKSAAKKHPHKHSTNSKKTSPPRLSRTSPITPTHLSPINNTPPGYDPSLIKKKRPRLSGLLLPHKKGSEFPHQPVSNPDEMETSIPMDIIPIPPINLPSRSFFKASRKRNKSIVSAPSTIPAELVTGNSIKVGDLVVSPNRK